jgi:hypothetical protein
MKLAVAQYVKIDIWLGQPVYFSGIYVMCMCIEYRGQRSAATYYSSE